MSLGFFLPYCAYFAFKCFLFLLYIFFSKLYFYHLLSSILPSASFYCYLFVTLCIFLSHCFEDFVLKCVNSLLLLFFLMYSFTILCQSLAIQPNDLVIYIQIFLKKNSFAIMVYHRILNIVPWAIK